MLLAFILVHAKNGFFLQNMGFEFVLMLFAVALGLTIIGSGPKWSLERAIFKKEY